MTTITLEAVPCYLCGSRASREFVQAEDDLGGTPGRFRFVRCMNCNLAYQNPRVPLDRIGAYYDDTYIAHRKKRNWGVLTPLFERAMHKLDEDKAAIVAQYIDLRPGTEVLDVGCAGRDLCASSSCCPPRLQPPSQLRRPRPPLR